MVVEKGRNFYPVGIPALFERWKTTVDKDSGDTENYLCLQLFCSKDV
jgi:hypothetical protein